MTTHDHDQRLRALLDEWPDAADQDELLRRVRTVVAETAGGIVQRDVTRANEHAKRAAECEERAEAATVKADREASRLRTLKRDCESAVTRKGEAEREATEAREACEEARERARAAKGKVDELKSELDGLTAERAAVLIQGERLLEAVRAIAGGAS